VAQNWLHTFRDNDPTNFYNCVVVIDEKYFYHRTLGRKCSNLAWCIGLEDHPDSQEGSCMTEKAESSVLLGSVDVFIWK
jgi:hypothetical protein